MSFESQQYSAHTGLYSTNQSSSGRQSYSRTDLDSDPYAPKVPARATQYNHSFYDHDEPGCGRLALTGLAHFGLFVLTPKRPRVRIGLGLLLGLTGAGLISILTSPLFATSMLASIHPVSAGMLLAAGIFLATVGTALFIQGLMANCRNKQVQKYRPIGYNPDVYNNNSDNENSEDDDTTSANGIMLNPPP